MELSLILRPTVWRGFSSIISCRVPFLGPLPVSVSMVTVTSVWPPAQGDVNPNVESAVTWRQHAAHSIRFLCLNLKESPYNDTKTHIFSLTWLIPCTRITELILWGTWDQLLTFIIVFVTTWAEHTVRPNHIFVKLPKVTL